MRTAAYYHDCGLLATERCDTTTALQQIDNSYKKRTVTALARAVKPAKRRPARRLAECKILGIPSKPNSERGMQPFEYRSVR